MKLVLLKLNQYNPKSLNSRTSLFNYKMNWTGSLVEGAAILNLLTNYNRTQKISMAYSRLMKNFIARLNSKLCFNNFQQFWQKRLTWFDTNPFNITVDTSLISRGCVLFRSNNGGNRIVSYIFLIISQLWTKALDYLSRSHRTPIFNNKKGIFFVGSDQFILF